MTNKKKDTRTPGQVLFEERWPLGIWRDVYSSAQEGYERAAQALLDWAFKRSREG